MNAEENVSIEQQIREAAYYVWVERAAGGGPGDALSDWLEGETEIESTLPPQPAAVSFQRDIVPLFSEKDIVCMGRRGMLLNDYIWMANAVAAESVYGSVADKSMPPGGPFWSDSNLALFRSWISSGFPQ